MKYSTFIGSSWVERTLHAESIPHLFHWDLAYLWILEREHLKPEVWQERVRAWRYLVALLLAGKLKTQDEPIRIPFIQYTQPYGVNKVTWALLGNERVGVLSPTVLVRPLPDFQPAELERWEQTDRHPEQENPALLKHFVKLAVDRLRRGNSSESYPSRLARILEYTFQPVLMDHPPGEAPPFSIPVLTKLVWSQIPAQPCVQYMNILLPGNGRENITRTYLPVCKNCRQYLTQDQAADGHSPAQDDFTITCEGCRYSNPLRLSDFLIWIRNREVVIWDHLSALQVPQKGLPPKPKVERDEIVFEWAEAQLAGEQRKRFLKLKFPKKEIQQHRIEEIFFDKILVPGDMPFAGLPVRPEWLDALENSQAIKPDVQTAAAPNETQTRISRIVYSQMHIHGWPVPIERVFPFESLRLKPKLAIGVYPNPQMMPEQWKWYRAFLHGPDRHEYEIQIDKGERLLPWVCETTKGCPERLSVIGKEEHSRKAGATYCLETVNRPNTTPLISNIYMGIDFGTTNTTIYFQGEDQINQEPAHEKHGLKPADVASVVKWFARSDQADDSSGIGDFLPGTKYGSDRRDPYIIPSALWEIEDRYLIRWTSDEPIGGSQAKAGFKWDNQPGDKLYLRFAFLKELLHLAVPLIIAKTRPRPDVHFHLGFAFPLTFDFTARKSMRDLVDSVGHELTAATQLRFDSYYTDESRASVKAFGWIGQQDAVLVADLGGGTMDLALFIGDNMPQIGSIKFAGEQFIRSYANRRHDDEAGREKFYWEIRDLIFSGKCHMTHGEDPNAERSLDRFCSLAFEFLRTMIAAYRQSNPNKKVSLVLVGNGWHLAEAFNRDTQSLGPEIVFNRHYEGLINLLGEGNIEFYNKEGGVLRRFPSSKHLVVSGALKNARERAVFPGQWEGSKLPSGRAVEFETDRGTVKIEWHNLVGDLIIIQGYSVEELLATEIKLQKDEMPILKHPWRDHLLKALGAADESQIPYLHEPLLKQYLFGGIHGTSLSFRRGPLQIILEEHWINLL